jgi:pimeloyl-ACP methyl ester carboxylesterase
MPTLQLNDAELFYEEAGSGEPVLLLHGLGSSTLDWAPQIEALKGSYRVIALDSRGSGRSRDLLKPGGPFSVAQFAADSAALLNTLGAAPAHVIGLSMGGMTAFQLAVDSPQSVRTLTIVNSGPELVPRTRDELRAFRMRRLISRMLGPKGMGKMLAKRLFPKPEHEEKRRLFRERMAANDKRAYIASQEAIIGWSVLDRIGGIEAPTLVVSSDQDYTPVAAKELWARRMKNARVTVVADARHALPIEFPEKLNPVLSGFLGQHRAGAGA